MMEWATDRFRANMPTSTVRNLYKTPLFQEHPLSQHLQHNPNLHLLCTSVPVLLVPLQVYIIQSFSYHINSFG